jgi:hypothetical protein
MRKLASFVMLLLIIIIVAFPQLNNFFVRPVLGTYTQDYISYHPQKFKISGEQQRQKLLSSLPTPIKRVNIALIVPIFTDAAYNNAFYRFYSIYANIKPGVNVTHNLDLLSSRVTALKPPTYLSSPDNTLHYLARHLTLMSPFFHVYVLTDADVDSGSIFFGNGTSRYDILILDHSEYVTQKEYYNLKEFVANGGTMILLDANTLYSQVGYDTYTQTITLIKGHSWEFNGKSAWRSVNETWANQNSLWTGSNFLCFHIRCTTTFANNPFGYKSHEEQYLTNPNDIILLNYNASVLNPNPKLSRNATIDHEYVVATYGLSYEKGKVISFGIFSDDLMNHPKFIIFFDHLLMGLPQVNQNERKNQ